MLLRTLLLPCMLLLLLRLLAAGRAPAGMDGWMGGAGFALWGCLWGARSMGEPPGVARAGGLAPRNLGKFCKLGPGAAPASPLGGRPHRTELWGRPTPVGRERDRCRGRRAGSGHSQGALRLEGRTSE